MTFTFIRDHQEQFPVQALCEVLEVSHSGYYAWRDRPESAQSKRRSELTEKIRRVHEHNRRVYGSPRVHRELINQGEKVCRNTVACTMKKQGIKALTHKRFKVRTTDANHPHPIAPNRLGRKFGCTRLDQVWLTDITSIHTDEGFLHLAGVMDLCSRRIIGWSMAAHMRVELVCEALNMAAATRGLKPGVIHPELLHHSDRGVQYACGQYQDLLGRYGIAVSMSNTGDCYDNAPKESFWGKLKTELVYLRKFTTHEQARSAIFDHIEVFYNRQRLHSSLDYTSPEQFEARLT